MTPKIAAKQVVSNILILRSDAEEWLDHEHIADPIQAQAQRLLDEAGSPELAKEAIDIATDRNPHVPDDQSEHDPSHRHASE